MRRIRSDFSSISSEEIDRLWVRQRIDICPVVDIYV